MLYCCFSERFTPQKKERKKAWDKEDIDELAFDGSFKQGFKTFDDADGIDKTGKNKASSFF